PLAAPAAAACVRAPATWRVGGPRPPEPPEPFAPAHPDRLPPWAAQRRPGAPALREALAPRAEVVREPAAREREGPRQVVPAQRPPRERAGLRRPLKRRSLDACSLKSDAGRERRPGFARAGESCQRLLPAKVAASSAAVGAHHVRPELLRGFPAEPAPSRQAELRNGV